MADGKIKTPVFVYDFDTVKNQLKEIRQAFGEARIFYSYKTNPKLGKAIHNLGLGLQVTSYQHLFDVLEFSSGENVFYNGKVLNDEMLEHLVNNNVHIVFYNLHPVIVNLNLIISSL